MAQCVNEVKRDNETLRQITNFQLSIENLVSGPRGPGAWPQGRGFPLLLGGPSPALLSAAQDQSLAHYGRPKIDGELKITTVERRSKMDR